MDADRILRDAQGKVHPMAGLRLGSKVTYATADGPVTLVSGGPAPTPRRVRLDATGGAFTVYLPAGPADGEVWLLQEVAGLTTAITVDGNGRNINGASTYTMNAAYRARGVIYDGTADAWQILWSNGV